jgi:hypothetical protein
MITGAIGAAPGERAKFPVPTGKIGTLTATSPFLCGNDVLNHNLASKFPCAA